MLGLKMKTQFLGANEEPTTTLAFGSELLAKVLIQHGDVSELKEVLPAIINFRRAGRGALIKGFARAEDDMLLESPRCGELGEAVCTSAGAFQTVSD